MRVTGNDRKKYCDRAELNNRSEIGRGKVNGSEIRDNKGIEIKIIKKGLSPKKYQYSKKR